MAEQISRFDQVRVYFDVTVDCGCIYYQRVHRNGNLDPQIEIHKDAEDGPCEACMAQEERWKDRVIDEVMVYNSEIPDRKHLILQVFCENIRGL